MKVTKSELGAEDKKVVAFYTGDELVFRSKHGDKNYILNEGRINNGGFSFEYYLSLAKESRGFIAFYEGDTIIIDL